MGYGTDLTDKQWQVIENPSDNKEHKPKHPLHFLFYANTQSLKIF